MERRTLPDTLRPTPTEQLDAVVLSINFHLKELKKEETGRKSRVEYVRNLNEIIGSNLYNIRLEVDDRDDIAMVELLGRSLAELRLVGVNSAPIVGRGNLVFEDKDRHSYILPVPALPDEFMVSVTQPAI